MPDHACWSKINVMCTAVQPSWMKTKGSAHFGSSFLHINKDQTALWLISLLWSDGSCSLAVWFLCRLTTPECSLLSSFPLLLFLCLPLPFFFYAAALPCTSFIIHAIFFSLLTNLFIHSFFFSNICACLLSFLVSGIVPPLFLLQKSLLLLRPCVCVCVFLCVRAPVRCCLF